MSPAPATALSRLDARAASSRSAASTPHCSSAAGPASRNSPAGTSSFGSSEGTVSCIYDGTSRHRRHDPQHSFEHPIALFYLDLDELPQLLGGRLVARRPGMLRFRRRDYLGSASLPLDVAVRDTIQAASRSWPTGPIRLLTQLRSFGHCFNPVSFYYCFDGAAERVEVLVAEVTNTPWGERHAYVLGATDTAPTGSPRSSGAVLTHEFDKAMHVSPFMAMDHRYLVRAATPGERLTVHIESRRLAAPAHEFTPAPRPPAFDAMVASPRTALEPAFEATLALRRTPLNPRTAARLNRRYPFACARVLGLIYGHAIALKLAGATVYPHPGSGPRPHHLTGRHAR